MKILETEIFDLITEARNKARGYAGFFGWSSDRDIEEWGVVTCLVESLEREGEILFTSLKRRGRPNDPPDCEALNFDWKRVAIEVTELVDEKAIKNYKSGAIHEYANWDKTKFIESLQKLLSRKDSKYPKLKEPPYDGGYIVVVHTDEEMLDRITVEAYLARHKFENIKYVTRAFLLLSYDPSIEMCPYYELKLGITI
ncbi:hypothetical protein MGMO_134c00060 [Methyloglobulus morosus KoM1]|uniref:Uncharacterized protein n=1 Tax=Methyloglobulus morosus KoM1 TaxID=1116472 RepID=V5DPS1_9GAMM|nr:hypothetical protein [Methyloglobulus morosus]ESS69431.1 hypothetical protein MGMO_134c00060 [Methyloglobulus morosus KoM1]